MSRIRSRNRGISLRRTIVAKDSISARFALSATRLDGPLRRVGELIDGIHRGIEYLGGVLTHVYTEDGPGRAPGLHLVKKHLEPLYISRHVYLEMKQEVMRNDAFRYDWPKPKVIVNKTRNSRGPWTVASRRGSRSRPPIFRYGE